MKLKPDWLIDKALVDYIVNPSNKGTIATAMPDSQTADGVPMRTKPRHDASELSESTQNYANGFQATIDYTFDRSRNDPNGWIQAGTSPKRLSYVGNSGLKFGANAANSGKEWEAAILDVDALFAEVASSGTAIDESNYVPFASTPGGVIDNANLIVTPYQGEPVNKLMTGVVYGGDYIHMKDNPNHASATIPSSAEQFFAMHVSNETRAQGKMTVDLRKTGSVWSLEIKLNGNQTYLNPNFDPGTVSKVFLQSHWGSGVVFTNMEVTSYAGSVS